MKKFNNVAVIMPCHGKSLMTQMSIESIFNQVDCQPLTVAVCDNNSQDDTWEMLNELQARYSSDRLRITQNMDPDNFGPARGNNRCLAMVKEADLVCRADNDVLFPSRFWSRFIKHAEQRIAEHPHIGVFTCRPTEQQDFGNIDSDPTKPKIDYAPLGEWYHSTYRPYLQKQISETTFFSREQIQQILNNTYNKGAELVNCPPTLDGYHEWVYNEFKDRYDLYPGGFCPALYCFTRPAVDAVPWHDEDRFTHSQLEDNSYIYLISRLGWTTCCFHDLYFHHYGSFTREFTGRHRASDGKSMEVIFNELWAHLNSGPGMFREYILWLREKGADWVQAPNPEVPDSSSLDEIVPIDLDDYQADNRETLT